MRLRCVLRPRGSDAVRRQTRLRPHSSRTATDPEYRRVLLRRSRAAREWASATEIPYHLVVGGGVVSTECLRLGLADEVRYSILPILTADGIPFFHKLNRDVALHLAESKPTGVAPWRFVMSFEDSPRIQAVRTGGGVLSANCVSTKVTLKIIEEDLTRRIRQITPVKER